MTGPDTPGADDQERFVVVINHEEQYALWPAGKTIPEMWKATGVSGTKAECLAHIKRVWTDMRPLSVRQRERPGGKDDTSA